MSSPQVAEKLQQEVERWRKTLMLLEQADTTQVRTHGIWFLVFIRPDHDNYPPPLVATVWAAVDSSFWGGRSEAPAADRVRSIQKTSFVVLL